MYGNIGEKIKSLAKAAFLIGSIVPVILGIAIMTSDEEFVGFGFVVLILGPFLAWVSTWLLYGFGELVERVCDIERNLRSRDIVPKAKPTMNFDPNTGAPIAKSTMNFDPNTGVPITQTPVNNYDRITNLNNLLEKGLITKEEYKQLLYKGQ